MLFSMQEHIWEREYQKPKLVTGRGTEPQASVKDFLRWLRRGDSAIPGSPIRELENLSVLNLGCGNGKNSNYICSLDATNRAVGVEISETALGEARTHAHEMHVATQTTYLKHSIGVALPFPDESFGLALDVTSSNSLNEAERAIYLTEVQRALKPTGFLFVRALCKDGDTNAQNLLKSNPGPERDTYILPDVGLTERIFSREDFIATYSHLFHILHLEKETHYTRFGGRSYKRNFWLAYLQKK
jgi:SAM-dependent methyltransferase